MILRAADHRGDAQTSSSASEESLERKGEDDKAGRPDPSPGEDTPRGLWGSASTTTGRAPTPVSGRDASRERGGERGGSQPARRCRGGLRLRVLLTSGAPAATPVTRRAEALSCCGEAVAVEAGNLNLTFPAQNKTNGHLEIKPEAVACARLTLAKPLEICLSCWASYDTLAPVSLPLPGVVVHYLLAFEGIMAGKRGGNIGSAILLLLGGDLKGRRGVPGECAAAARSDRGGGVNVLARIRGWPFTFGMLSRRLFELTSSRS
eukprot:CAMPEP_0206412084 /NCGR_PEP_ID=MMETSP0294-20121207/33741_1 /ASSEMBLY_ACC=CAM_ASM_000327 /TAXON_ID=39354 /ORGANISM="Heterosigma akashiwo, Strain CCMP2393" /LENGTH=262 /DNA_ID=CAMNT_0053873081 /DNA_START=237 /DNA_END=1029 /DNA_ORIENTATION=+